MYTGFHRSLVGPSTAAAAAANASAVQGLLQVISGDESGTVCMWNIHTGAREGNFKHCHGSGRLTAMTLDAQVCLWRN